MGAAQESASRAGQIIVHHLSDLNHQENRVSTDNKLVTYQRYLGGLPDDRYPDVVVITGNLTATGTKEDLSAVMTMLRSGFPHWDGQLYEHVFIVPGPQDFNWQVLNNVGLDTFYKLFEPFATPYHTPTPPGRDSPASQSANFVGYPLDTCYAPEELDEALKAHFKKYTRDFGKFAKRRGRVGAKWLGLWKRPGRLTRRARVRAREQALQALRSQFLMFTEGARPLDLRAGRVTEADLARFKVWAQSQAASMQASGAQASSGAAPTPLKMLITHHPIVIRASEASDDTAVAKRSFKPLLDAAREAGVHLALHGHIHNGEALTDQSAFQRPGAASSICQLGAASLAATSVFNEITAVYRAEPAQGQGQPTGDWQLTVRTVNLSAAGPVASRGTFGNQAALADRELRRLNRAVALRGEFERMLRYAMRRFSEQVYQARLENRQNPQRMAPLPQEALLLIRDVISSVIFKGLETRVRLLLRSNEGGPVPRLVPTYLTPAIMEGPGALVYPASVAAWSLVLGRKLIYPDIESATTTPEDHDWLRQSGKIPRLLEALKALANDAGNTNALDEATRCQTLYTNLDAIKVGAMGAIDAKILGLNIYQKGPAGSPQRSYTAFICVPYPIRPVGGALPTLPEIAVLDVGVRPVEPPDPQDTSPIPVGPFMPFTPERIEMLETVTDLIGMMLTAADALGRPPGVWSDNLW
ncbi:MAG TPA: hypothetical protein VE338_01170 [Ktedonobacterales bacterium]|nr:hypothetical protein [Ktedonobacterales bacterium]